MEKFVKKNGAAMNKFFVGVALAQGGTIQLQNPLGFTNISAVIDNIAGYLILVAAPIAVLMVLFAAFQIMSAGGSEEKVLKGKKTILYAVVGFAIILISKGITLIVKQLLGV